MRDIYNCMYLPQTIFCFYFIGFQFLNISLPNFAFLTVKLPSIIYRSVRFFFNAKIRLCFKTIGLNILPYWQTILGKFEFNVTIIHYGLCEKDTQL